MRSCRPDGRSHHRKTGRKRQGKATWAHRRRGLCLSLRSPKGTAIFGPVLFSCTAWKRSMGRRLPMRNRYWTKPPDDSDIAGIPCPCNAFSRGYTPAKASHQDRVAGSPLARPERALTQDEAWRRAEPRRLFVVAWLQAGWMIATQIDPFCASPTDRTKGTVPVLNGGSRAPLRLRSVTGAGRSSSGMG